MELPNILSNVKTSDSKIFTHFSSDRRWSDYFTDSVGHSVQNMDLPTFMSHRANAGGPVNVYMTRRLRSPDTHPIVQELAPCMGSSLPVTKGVEAEVSLWMSSSNTCASPHYDMEHNFFLQLNSSKRFLLASPLHSSLFRPHSALHPRWRQGQAVHLSTASAIRDRLNAPDGCDGYAEKNDACRLSRSLGGGAGEGGGKRHPQDVRVVEVGSGIHEIELTAGQMLYLPPFYFHAVTTTDPYSVSVNAWVGSKYLTAATRLSTAVQLPYLVDADEAGRVQAIGALVNMVLVRLGRRFKASEFAWFLKSRVQDIRIVKESEQQCTDPTPPACNDTYPFSTCTDRSIALAGLHSLFLCSHWHFIAHVAECVFCDRATAAHETVNG